MLLQHLPLTNINLADDSFRITFAPDLDELKQSIRAVGLAQPLILRHTPEGTYQLVAGFKRFLVLRDLNRQTVPVIIYEHHELTPAQAFLTNLHDNAVSRDLNIVEKSIALNKLKLYCSASEEDLVKDYLPLLQEEASYKVLHELLSLGSLTEPMKQHIITSTIALSSASRMAEFTPTTQQSLLAVLHYIRPSTAKLNELLSLIREISARDGVSVESILERYQLLTIVANQDSSQSEKVNALRETLRHVRLPQLTERQKQLAMLIRDLELPDKARLIADPYFESQKFKLEYKFSQPEELDALIAKIKNAFEKQQWHRIFDWYRA